MPDDNPLIRNTASLIGVILALILSIMVAAMAAGRLDGGYETRAYVYTGCVLWVLTGAVVMFVISYRGESERGTARLSVSRVLLWTASIWLWPLFLLLKLRNRN